MKAGRVLLAAVAFSMALAAIGDPWIAASNPMAALALRDFFSAVCHQNPARSFVLDGSPAAVCSRCLGIYCGIVFGALLSFRLRLEGALAPRIFLGALLFNLLDVAMEAVHLHGNLPLPRFLLGASLGLAAGLLLCGQAPELTGQEAGNERAGKFVS